jgi:hypothetical protein
MLTSILCQKNVPLQMFSFFLWMACLGNIKQMFTSENETE